MIIDPSKEHLKFDERLRNVHFGDWIKIDIPETPRNSAMQIEGFVVFVDPYALNKKNWICLTVQCAGYPFNLNCIDSWTILEHKPGLRHTK